MKFLVHILSCFLLFSCSESSLSDKKEDSIKTAVNDSVEGIYLNKSDTLQSELIRALESEENGNYSLEEFRQKSLDLSFKEARLYSLSDTINADFNGDGLIDEAIYSKNDETSGIIIIHGQTNEEFRIGFGKAFAHMKEFNWVDYWGLVLDTETFEISSSGNEAILTEKEIELRNPSIVLKKDEVGGGLITFLKGEYVWIHQTS